MKINGLFLIVILFLNGCLEPVKNYKDIENQSDSISKEENSEVSNDLNGLPREFMIVYGAFLDPLTRNRESYNDMIEILALKYNINKDTLNKIMLRYLRNMNPSLYTSLRIKSTQDSIYDAIDEITDTLTSIRSMPKLELDDLMKSIARDNNISQKELATLLYDFYIWRNLLYLANEIDDLPRSY
jgi:hypothetical protein